MRFPRIARGPACGAFAFQFCEEPAFEHCSGALMFSILEGEGAAFSITERSSATLPQR